MNNEEKILYMLESLVAKVDKLEQGQTKLEQGQTKLEREVTYIREGFIRMEIDHGNQLKALWESNQLIQDKLSEHDRRFEQIDRRFDSVDQDMRTVKSALGAHEGSIAELWRKTGQ